MEKPGRRYIKFLCYSNLTIWGTWVIATGVLAIQLVWPVVPDNVREVIFYTSLGSGGVGSIVFAALVFAMWDLAWYHFCIWRRRGCDV